MCVLCQIYGNPHIARVPNRISNQRVCSRVLKGIVICDLSWPTNRWTRTFHWHTLFTLLHSRIPDTCSIVRIKYSMNANTNKKHNTLEGVMRVFVSQFSRQPFNTNETNRMTRLSATRNVFLRAGEQTHEIRRKRPVRWVFREQLIAYIWRDNVRQSRSQANTSELCACALPMRGNSFSAWLHTLLNAKCRKKGEFSKTVSPVICFRQSLREALAKSWSVLD